MPGGFMNRQVYLLGVGLSLVALAFVATDAALGPRPGVTKANFERIRVGMTLEEVQAVLGPASPNGLGVCSMAAGHEEVWFREDVLVCLSFDATGRVRGKGWYPVIYTGPLSSP